MSWRVTPRVGGWHDGHVIYVDVDDFNVLFESCRFPNGTFCGDADIIGETTAKRADAVRRAARAYRESTGISEW